MAISRETARNPPPTPRERVELPEFGDGEYVWVHGMNARENNLHQASMWNKTWTAMDRSKIATQKERMVIACCRDDDGKHIFTDEDEAAIGLWPVAVLNRVFSVANRLSGGEKTVSDEQAVKNSDEIGSE